MVESIFSNKGRDDSDQPFYRTYVLEQNDTNYVLVKFTPNNESESKWLEGIIKTPGIDLYQQYRFSSQDGVKLIIDNSESLPVNKLWPHIYVSCPTVKQ